MPAKSLGPLIDALGVLASVAKAVPVLGATVEGSLEALKQILQYTKVCLLSTICLEQFSHLNLTDSMSKAIKRTV
jgi:hypothetical protein